MPALAGCHQENGFEASTLNVLEVTGHQVGHGEGPVANEHRKLTSMAGPALRSSR
jgi:hypothetical protein